MKAIINHNNFVKLEDVETPQIDAVNNVLIKVKLAAICRTDLYVAEGIIPSNEGIILGHEFYGEVVHVFNNVQKCFCWRFYFHKSYNFWRKPRQNVRG